MLLMILIVIIFVVIFLVKKKQVYTYEGQTKHQQTERSDGLLELVRQIFRKFIAFLFILFIISCATIGGFIGHTNDEEYIVLGALIGFIIGGLLVILVGGYLATIIEIGENVKALRKDIAKIKPLDKL